VRKGTDDALVDHLIEALRRSARALAGMPTLVAVA